MTAPPLPHLIDTTNALIEFCNSLAQANWLALDTEFMRERTYYPRFCLLQIATANSVVCIDPIVLPSLEPLQRLLLNEHIIKVVHAGRQDLEIFYHLFGKIPRPIFDTQIAAPLIGLAEHISYARLVEDLLGISLSKSHSRTDWSRRPLSPEQLRYAADDVIYLAAAYPIMLSRLRDLGRLDWLVDDFDELTDAKLYSNPPELAWRRIGGAHYLNSRGLAALQQLAAWRETVARTEDTPRNWVIKDEVLLDAARQQPQSLESLEIIRGLDQKTVRRHGRALIRVIADASRLGAPETVDRPLRPTKRPIEHEIILDVLGAIVRLRASHATLNPSILANRKDLENLLDGEADCKLLQGWRKKMVGEELCAVLKGELRLSICEGALRVD